MLGIISSIIPMFAIIGLGATAERYQLIQAGAAKVLNQFVFRFALPLMLFAAVSQETLDDILHLRFIGSLCLATFAVFFIGVSMARFVFKRNPKEVIFHGFVAGLSNEGYMGIPLLLGLFGKQALVPGAVGITITYLLISFCVILLEVVQAKETPSKDSLISAVLYSLFRNPVLSALIAGMLYSLLGLPLPTIVENFCHLMGRASLPCALFAIGQIVYAQGVFKGSFELSSMVILKLLLQPFIVYLMMLWLGVSPLWAVSGVLLAGMPTGVILVILAGRYNAYLRNTSAAVLVSTLFSVVTLPFWLFVTHNHWPGLFTLSGAGL